MPQSSLFFRPALIFAALLLGAGIALRDVSSAAESARSVPPPVLDTPANPQATSEIAILAGGCFWGVQGWSGLKMTRTLAIGCGPTGVSRKPSPKARQR